jgi:hypothetical protein
MHEIDGFRSQITITEFALEPGTPEPVGNDQLRIPSASLNLRCGHGIGKLMFWD